MLVIFKSKVAGDIIMYEENAKPILELMGKEVSQGIIQPDEIPGLLSKLDAEIARRKEMEAQEKVEREAAENEKVEREARARENGDVEELEKLLLQKERQKDAYMQVSFSARAFPLIEMLKRAHRKNKEVVWGV